MPVYTISSDRSYDEATGNYGFANETLDGDFKGAFPIGIDFDPGVKAALLDDGMVIHQSAEYQGLPVDMSGLPKRVRWGGGKRDLGDLQITADHFLVSPKLRDVIEKLEPEVHQFQPAEIIWEKDDSHAADFFWFNPCNRVDGIDQTHSTTELNENTGTWRYDGGEFVVNLDQVAGYHVWIDKRASFATVWVSEEFYKATEEAGIKGIRFGAHEAV
ncbi:hypothetical protein ATL17_1703 [Maritalea mobilis]|uniref:Immunity MXAN-0049 protein domain-containing protein n=1 Tax=Maritalea mobilis TaxID=483324 RepID=A0A4R6VNB5_9HYPH|nr:DUF1629 domain-containing protein [Maritalea mobilis]TDQ63696.1 hypothetical protein ATL17_1703 [Maritalea mobilis]